MFMYKCYGELTEQMLKNKEAPVRYRCYIAVYIYIRKHICTCICICIFTAQ